MVDTELVFHYRQEDKLVKCEYSGGEIICGHLLGKVDDDGSIEMRYHQLLKDGSLQTGICLSTPEITEDGTIKLHEKWQWTCGDFSTGQSVLVEI